MQVDLMEGYMQEEHKTRFLVGDSRARGYAQAVLNRMYALYDPMTNPADHARIAELLPSKQDVLNKASAALRSFPDNVWPHVAAAKAEAALAAAEAAAVRQREVDAGLDMPTVFATPSVCVDWMNKFLQERIEPGGPTKHRFKAPLTITYAQANDVLTRVQAWKLKTNSKAVYNSFENKLRDASALAFDPAYRR
jgi:hypothetical protein